MSRRVVVTGLGVVTSLGFEVPDFWDRICAGKSGIGQIARFDCSDYKVHFAGEIKEFDLTEHMQIDSKEVKRLDRFVQFAMAAAAKAVRQSGMDFSQGDQYRNGVLIGSGIGGLEEIEQQHIQLFDRGPSRVSPFMIPKLMVNAASGNISVMWGLRGPNLAVATACASGANAIGDAFRLIQLGLADAMVCGGAESAITPLGVAGFASAKALSFRNDDPATASRPFDAERDGFVIGEGAGVLVLESLEHAQARGAQILAELVGYGMTCDAHHITSPTPGGVGGAEAMRLALQDARLEAEAVDYVNAHGTSTPANDSNETAAIKSALGERARQIPVSSTKSMTGHLLGGSGGIEAVAAVLAIGHNLVPPTINYQNPDPACDLDVVPNQAREQSLNVVLSNSFGFGGHNVCLAFRRLN